MAVCCDSGAEKSVEKIFRKINPAEKTIKIV